VVSTYCRPYRARYDGRRGSDSVPRWQAPWRAAAAVLALLIAIAHPAEAATVRVKVMENGVPLADAVVSVSIAGAPVPPVPPKHAIMVQEGQQFVPAVLPVEVGTTVDFPNRDPFRHHVYSFSAPKPFELKLYGGDQIQSVTFNKPGPVVLGCNIHDNMLAYIYVVNTPYFARTNDQGVATIDALPAGTYTLSSWHPRQKTAQPDQSVTLGADGDFNTEVTIATKTVKRQSHPGAVDERPY
jgi:plastocyanin